MVRELRAVPVPEGFAPLADTRLVQLAAAVASSVVRHTPRLELYRRDLSLERALRISQAGAGVRPDRGITATELVARVGARFPDLNVLSDGREPTPVVLEDALQAARFDLRHDDEAGRFLPPLLKSTGPWSSTGSVTSMLPPARSVVRREPEDPHGELREQLAESVRRGGFLALTVKAARLQGTAEMIAARFPVVPVDLGALFLREFRRLVEEKGQDWRTVLRADAASAPGRVKPGLATFVRVVWQRVADDLAACSTEPRTVLFLHDAGLIARYWDEGGRAFLVTLQAAARRPSEGPHGLWLLCPMESSIQDPRRTDGPGTAQ
ncbi:hypothetical protein GCM10020367_49870 [Streptomyces sannanensis]|uniref:Uncharacterized protein n=1 Tax=Streptomyces sannanensis TaxID=285536 RepID=A0ABP6SHP1_9ACTN